MVRSDWEQFNGADTDHYLDEDHAYEGKTSLHVQSRGASVEIYEDSLADAPVEGRMTFYARSNSDHSFTTFWRFQDPDSFYTVSLGTRNRNQGTPRIYLGTDDNRIDEKRIDPAFSDTVRSAVDDTLDEGEFWGPREDFVPYRVDFWIDDAGDVRAAVYEDADRDGEWTKLATELVDEDPKFTDGGGVGVGGANGSYTNDYRQNYRYWIDETEIYY